MLPGLPAFESLTGGGGLSSSTSATSGGDQRNANRASQNAGGMNVGGLNMAPDGLRLDAETIGKGAAVVGIGLAAVWLWKQI
ncbi:hypothetical protein [Marinimicrobium sp. C2-29]|uniref:hypothetical protein n=1 Tax=Marinimicrobium sp. C2-29 TaxID=3139825 RepID=UPI00313884CF